MSDTVYRGLYVISEGQIEGSTELAKTIYFNSVPAQSSDGSLNFEGMSLAYRDGRPDQTPITGFDAAVTPVAVGVTVTYASPVEVTVAGTYDAANVTLRWASGLYRVSDAGQQKGEDSAYSIEVKSNGSSLWVPVVNTILKYQKILTAFEESHRIPLPAGGSPWLVRVKRNSADTGNPNIVNNFTFQRYEAVIDGKFSYPNIALLGVELGAKQFENNIPAVSMKTKGIKVWVPKNYDPITRVYSTTGAGTSSGLWDGTFKLAYTNNPVWVYFDVVTNNRYGLGKELNPSNDLVSALADKWNLYIISQYCDGMVDDGYGGTEPRFTFNAYINSKADAYEFLKMIVSSFRGMLYFASDQIYVTADIPDTADSIFTQADVKNGVFNYSGSPLNTRSSIVYVKWRNPTNLYKTEVEVYEDLDAILELGYREKTIEGIGVTSRGLARRLAKYMLLTEQKQTQVLSFTTGLKGARLFPGRLIKISDSYKAGIRFGGKILDVDSTDITLDQPVTLQSGVEYTLTYVRPNGSLISSAFTPSSTVTTSTWDVSPGLSANDTPILGATWFISSVNLDAAQYRVIGVRDKGNNEYEVNAVQHYANKYAEVEDGPAFATPPVSVYDQDTVLPPTNLTVSEWYEPVGGSEAAPRLTVSWVAPNDNKVAKYEVQFRTGTTPFSTTYLGPNITWDTERLPTTEDLTYQVRVRSMSKFGSFSSWVVSDLFSVLGKDVAPTPPSNLAITAAVSSLFVTWDNAALTDFKGTELWVGATSSLGAATLLTELSDDYYVYNTTPGTTKYFWVRTKTHALTNNVSTYVGPVNATAKYVDETVFGSAFQGIPIVSSLPNPTGYTGSKVVFLTTDSKLYRYTGTAWTLAVAATELTGQLTDSQIATLASTKITGQLTDSQIAAVAAAKLTGTITTTQIGNNSISTPKIQAGAISSNEIAANSIVAGNISSGAITTAKLAAGAVTANEIAANSILANNIAANQITTAKLAAGAVTANEIAANAVTANAITAGAITAAKIAANAVTATSIQAGTITGDRISSATIVTDNLVDNSVTVPTITSASGTVTGNGTAQLVLSSTVPLTQAGQISVNAAIAQHFPSGNRTWSFDLRINGTTVFYCYGANSQDSVAVAGALYCAAGNIPVELYWTGQNSTVNIDYRSLTCSGNMK